MDKEACFKLSKIYCRTAWQQGSLKKILASDFFQEYLLFSSFLHAAKSLYYSVLLFHLLEKPLFRL